MHELGTDDGFGQYVSVLLGVQNGVVDGANDALFDGKVIGTLDDVLLGATYSNLLDHDTKDP